MSDDMLFIHLFSYLILDRILHRNCEIAGEACVVDAKEQVPLLPQPEGKDIDDNTKRRALACEGAG